MKCERCRDTGQIRGACVDAMHLGDGRCDHSFCLVPCPECQWLREAHRPDFLHPSEIAKSVIRDSRITEMSNCPDSDRTT